jgi:DMSO/TMAO reductase YedYZ molybdopterin-dependent catalytic subunit
MRPRASRAAATAAVAGAIALAAAITEAELLAGITGTVPLVDAVAGLLISIEPPGAKDVAIAVFGDADKVALEAGVVLAAVAIGALLGVASARRPNTGAVGIGLLGLVGGAAAAREPLVGLGTAIVAAGLAVATGVAALRWLTGLAGLRHGARSRTGSGSPLETHEAEASPMPGEADDGTAWPRRRFLIASAGVLGGAAVSGAVGRELIGRAHPEGVVTSTRLPAAIRPALDPTGDEVLNIAGLPPIVTPADRLYRVDIALEVPQVDVELWRLDVIGMVDHPLSLTYDELLAFPLFEQYVTLACVSNEVGGHLVGSPLWTGVRLKDVLAECGVKPGATQIMGRSWSDFSAGFPTSWALAEGREPMIAVGMDRAVLPAAHGFPARLIVPGLYGYVSATKWLTQIELTTTDAQDGFWIPLGWAKDGPILTQSRIDVPAFAARLAAGPVTVAGVAWAGDRGVAAVELRVDGGPWQTVRLSRPLSAATWVQWSGSWVAAPGQHVLEVRATDGTGAVQTDEITRPAPGGAHGLHKVTVSAG